MIAEAHPWIFWLLGAEALRQAHGLIGERWSGYHRFWSGRVFGGFARWSRRRFSAGTRFRAARALKIAFWLVTLSLALGAVLGTSPFFALLRVPERLPVVLPVLVIVLAVAGLAWFLSRGGVETYRPGDITTRFADVWGQDHVLEQLRECVVRLDRPGEIERRGGHLPGGVLLWGPPGTGKTLLAEAVAGETGRPYVVVDSGAFTGVLKMKALFRRVRKLALRHGGVVVLFDEADALGRRAGPARQGRAARPARPAHSAQSACPARPARPPVTASPTCRRRPGRCSPSVAAARYGSRKPATTAPCGRCSPSCPRSASRAGSSTGRCGGCSGCAPNRRRTTAFSS